VNIKCVWESFAQNDSGKVIDVSTVYEAPSTLRSFQKLYIFFKRIN